MRERCRRQNSRRGTTRLKNRERNARELKRRERKRNDDLSSVPKRAVNGRDANARSTEAKRATAPVGKRVTRERMRGTQRRLDPELEAGEVKPRAELEILAAVAEIGAKTAGSAQDFRGEKSRRGRQMTGSPDRA